MEFSGETLYNIAAGLGFIAYLLTNVLWLRIFLVIGACFYIAAGIVLSLDSMIGWHVAYALINLGHVIILIMDKHATTLPEPFKSLYSERFASIKPREFRRLIKIHQEATVKKSKVITQGERNDKLYLITEGHALVNLDGKHIARLVPGDFFGEMSVLSGKPTTSDVYADDVLKFVHWSKTDLQKIEKRNLSLYNRFMMAVGLNVIEKLQHTTASSLSERTA
jgi:hypothetical protein